MNKRLSRGCTRIHTDNTNSFLRLFYLCASVFICGHILSAQDARQIIQESQRRGRADSERYEGSLEVIASNNKITKKSWTYVRIGAYGNSKTILRFNADRKS